MDIQIRTEVFPTEDPEKVRAAVLNLFPDAAVLESGEKDMLIMAAHDIQTLARRIAEMKIRDTARAILQRSIRGSVFHFQLNKQAAYSGKVNFIEGNSILGSIDVIIGKERPRELLEIITGGIE